jgi:hypothetical protein
MGPQKKEKKRQREKGDGQGCFGSQKTETIGRDSLEAGGREGRESERRKEGGGGEGEMRRRVFEREREREERGKRERRECQLLTPTAIAQSISWSSWVRVARRTIATMGDIHITHE